MRKVLAIILALSLLVSMASIGAYAQDTESNPFVDVAESAWYHDEVIKAVASGIINGKTKTEFKPDDLLTYAEAVKLAACMHQVHFNGTVTLTNGTPWYQPYVEYCKANKIITKDYPYDTPATRAGYIEIFANALPDSEFEDINNIPDGSILDVKDNAPYAIYVYKLYRAGIVTGVDALHNCKPDANIKRCEVAAIIARMMDDSQRVRFDMGEEEPKEEDPEEEPEEDPKEEPGNTNENQGGIKLEESDVNIGKDNHISVVVPPEEEKPEFDVGGEYLDAPLTIAKHPEGLEADSYGGTTELEVQVYGGKAPYTYTWQYNGYRNQKTVIENGAYASGADERVLTISIEKDNALLGNAISCKITDSAGAVVTSDAVRVYGPFSMPVESSLNDSGKNVLTGRVADGIIRKGDKVSVLRNGKVIATGVAADLQMFGKSLDESAKGDNIGIVFERTEGARPQPGDIVIKYQDTHVVDTSDIVN